MSKQELSSCGPVELLRQLRNSQKIEPSEGDVNVSSQKQESRLDKYLKEGKKQRNKEENTNATTITRYQIEETDLNSADKIHELDPHLIHRWSEKDRPENELGNIEDLAKSFKQIGQQVPCIVRLHKENAGEYELIVGECRWHAAKLAGIPLKAIIHTLDDRMAALIQAAENEERSDLSEYAKGMSYATKIEKGILSQKDLTDILGISRQQVSRLLSFNRIPQRLVEAIDDFRKVSSRTAEEICRLSAKGNNYIEALIGLAPKIKTGKFGEKRIQQEINKFLNKEVSKELFSQKVLNKDGRHLFTWRQDNNGIPSIHFPNDIIQLLQSKTMDFDQVTQDIKECLVKHLSEI